MSLYLLLSLFTLPFCFCLLPLPHFLPLMSVHAIPTSVSFLVCLLSYLCFYFHVPDTICSFPLLATHCFLFVCSYFCLCLSGLSVLLSKPLFLLILLYFYLAHSLFLHLFSLSLYFPMSSHPLVCLLSLFSFPALLS